MMPHAGLKQIIGTALIELEDVIQADVFSIHSQAIVPKVPDAPYCPLPVNS